MVRLGFDVMTFTVDYVWTCKREKQRDETHTFRGGFKEGSLREAQNNHPWYRTRFEYSQSLGEHLSSKRPGSGYVHLQSFEGNLLFIIITRVGCVRACVRACLRACVRA